MREILFRGTRGDGKWIYGNLLLHKSAKGICGINTLKEIGRVIPETVCQYTGLTDKNDNKIFEGDIVRFVNYINDIYHEEIGVCLFEQAESNFCLQYTVKNPENYPVPKTTHTIYLISNTIYKDDCWYEAIGNKWDNPELLKGGAEL